MDSRRIVIMADEVFFSSKQDVCKNQWATELVLHLQNCKPTICEIASNKRTPLTNWDDPPSKTRLCPWHILRIRFQEEISKANLFQPNTKDRVVFHHVFHVFTPWKTWYDFGCQKSKKPLRNSIATFLLTYQSHKMELVINGHRNVQGADVNLVGNTVRTGGWKLSHFPVAFLWPFRLAERINIWIKVLRQLLLNRLTSLLVAASNYSCKSGVAVCSSQGFIDQLTGSSDSYIQINSQSSTRNTNNSLKTWSFTITIYRDPEV